jgi:hypothetical protein
MTMLDTIGGLSVTAKFAALLILGGALILFSMFIWNGYTTTYALPLGFMAKHPGYFLFETIMLAIGTGALTLLPVFARAEWRSNTAITGFVVEKPLLVGAKMLGVTLLLHFSGIYDIGNAPDAVLPT